MFGERTGLAVQVVLKLFAELLYEGYRRHRRRIAKRAKRPAEHVFSQVLNVVDVLGNTKAGVKTCERFLEPVRAFAARDAPAATFVLIETDGTQRELDDTGLVIDNHDAAGAEHGAGFAHLVEVHSE